MASSFPSGFWPVLKDHTLKAHMSLIIKPKYENSSSQMILHFSDQCILSGIHSHSSSTPESAFVPAHFIVSFQCMKHVNVWNRTSHELVRVLTLNKCMHSQLSVLLLSLLLLLNSHRLCQTLLGILFNYMHLKFIEFYKIKNCSTCQSEVMGDWLHQIIRVKFYCTREVNPI